MNIGLDFDGVIANCGELKSETAKRLFGIKIPPEKFKKEAIISNGILDPEQYEELQKTAYGTREIGLLMKPVDGAIGYISRLLFDGHSIKVITSRDPDSMQVATEWMAKKGLFLRFISSEGKQDKAEKAKGLDIFIDDDLKKLEKLSGVVPFLFLFSWGYNASEKEKGIAKRVFSWKEIYQTIRTLRNVQ